METEKLRDLVSTACTRLSGKLWPNGLGFDRRGWAYYYVERTARWTARYDAAWNRPGGSAHWGWGDSPESAIAHARSRR